MLTQQLELECVSDLIAVDAKGKRRALNLVDQLPVSRALALLKTVDQSLRTQANAGRPCKSPLAFLKVMAMQPRALVGPFGGKKGAPVLTALFLADHAAEFEGWLVERGMDPAPCRQWVAERQAQWRLAGALQASSAVDGGSLGATRG